MEPNSQKQGHHGFLSHPIKIGIFILIGLIIIGIFVIWLFPIVSNLFHVPPKTNPCGDARLQIGTNFLTIKAIKKNSGNNLSIPADTSGIAYWVEGSDINYVFGVSPTANNQTLFAEVREGDIATVTWENCNTSIYALSLVQPGNPDITALLDQSNTQISIFIPGDATFAGLVINGELQGDTLISFNTPDASSMLVEISFLGTTASPDQTTINVSVSVNNFGKSSIKLTAEDVSLTPEGGFPLSPINIDPSTLKGIKPGATETITFTFPRPPTTTATFKIYTIEYILDGY